MPNVIRALSLSNAAAYECARTRHDVVDVDHVFLALLATGGSAARILTEHGVTLDSARIADERRLRDSADEPDDPTSQPIPVADPRYDVSGDLPWAARASALVSTPTGRMTDLDLLAALLADESGIVGALVESHDIEAGAVSAQVETALQDGDGCEPEVGEHAFAPDDSPATTVSLDHVLAQPVPQVWLSLIDPGLVCLWAGSPETSRVVSGGVETTFERLGHRGYIRLDPSLVEEPSEAGARVVWQERVFSDKVDGEPGGWYDLQLSPLGWGATMRLTRGLRTFGTFGRALMPIARRTTASNIGAMAQDIGYASARRP